MATLGWLVLLAASGSAAPVTPMAASEPGAEAAATSIGIQSTSCIAAISRTSHSLACHDPWWVCGNPFDDGYHFRVWVICKNRDGWEAHREGNWADSCGDSDPHESRVSCPADYWIVDHGSYGS
jgi:hypothetical protein